MNPAERIKELEEALELAADSIADFGKAFALFEKPVAAAACVIAEKACLAILGPRS